jgi:hypothetical protein
MSALPPRDPWANEVGENDRFGVFAFFTAMIVFAGVAYALYARAGSGGGHFGLDIDNLLWQDRTGVKLSQSLPGQLGEPPTPLKLKPGVAPGTAAQVQTQVVQPPAQANSTAAAAQPTAVPATKSDVYVPPVAAAMGIPGAQPQPTATAAPQPTPTAAPAQPQVGAKYKVVNTNGDGVYIRRTPAQADRIVPWPDNTLMEYAGEQTDNEGIHWAKMKDPRGNVGWVPAQYLAPA